MLKLINFASLGCFFLFLSIFVRMFLSVSGSSKLNAKSNTGPSCSEVIGVNLQKWLKNNFILWFAIWVAQLHNYYQYLSLKKTQFGWRYINPLCTEYRPSTVNRPTPKMRQTTGELFLPGNSFLRFYNKHLFRNNCQVLSSQAPSSGWGTSKTWKLNLKAVFEQNHEKYFQANFFWSDLIKIWKIHFLSF